MTTTIEERRRNNREKMALWRTTNREHHLAYQRSYNKALRQRDPELVRSRERNRYQRDGARMRERTNGYRAKRRAQVIALKDQPCADCGGRFHWFAMQFDHLPEYGEKAFIISEGLRRSWQAILDEIAKCELVCANCHAMRTYRRGFRR